ncbi:MAG: DUF1501 domain-containing protein [Planctomycetaceae bacterium]|nr:DUF1501 domain-containing protein [Planctomycetaceae bacterium]
MHNSSFSRRGFLASSAAASAFAAADMTGLDVLRRRTHAAEMKKRRKSVILLWLAGGASQLETFDPKPGRSTGGPYRSIPTSVPGVHFSELMPKMAARLAKNTAIIRSLNTKIADHGGGATLMSLGRRDEPSVRYPDLGAVIARELGQADTLVPDYVSFYAQTEGRGSAVGQSGFLGARYLPMFLTDKSKPDNLQRLPELTEVDHRRRADLRELMSKRFAAGRDSAAVGSHNQAYARVHGLMSSEKLFDVEQESQKMRDRYGPTQFGQQALVARRLVEAGVPFVKVGRGWWDSHGENFETHLELVTELDHVMSTLLDDLSERGLLENTLVVTLSEFGRTPRINASLGRDHFAAAWSCSLSGCGIHGGAVYGKTDDDGQTVKDGEVSAAGLFATIYEALGIDVTKEYHVGPRPIPIVDGFAGPVGDILA